MSSNRSIQAKNVQNSKECEPRAVPMLMHQVQLQESALQICKRREHRAAGMGDRGQGGEGTLGCADRWAG